MAYILSAGVTEDDLEHAIRARAKASRGIWLTRAFAAYFVVVAYTVMVMWWSSTASGPWLPLVAVLSLVVAWYVGTGRLGRRMRRLMAYRSHPELFGPATAVVDDEGVAFTDARGPRRYGWDRWAAWVRTPEGIALLTSPRGATAYDLLLRRGLDVPGGWDDVVAFVDSRVPRHPGDRDPKPPRR